MTTYVLVGIAVAMLITAGRLAPYILNATTEHLYFVLGRTLKKVAAVFAMVLKYIKKIACFTNGKQRICTSIVQCTVKATV